jgi:hypothetical protein
VPTWFRSRGGAVTVSWLALLAFLGRTMLDWRYVYPDEVPEGAVTVASLVVTVALVAGWIWSILAAGRGERRGTVGALALVLFLGIGLAAATAVALCPSPCQTAWPLMEIANCAQLVLGVLAAVALGIQLRRTAVG